MRNAGHDSCGHSTRLFRKALFFALKKTRLNEQLKFVSGQFLYNMRMMGWRHALEQEDITLPENPNNSTIAMHMILE